MQIISCQVAACQEYLDLFVFMLAHQGSRALFSGLNENIFQPGARSGDNGYEGSWDEAAGAEAEIQAAIQVELVVSSSMQRNKDCYD